MTAGAKAEWSVDVRDDLGDFRRETLKFLDRAKQVFIAGSGPAVVVIHEMPGITPQVARFARRVRDAGFTVYMPSLTGEPGKPFSATYMAGEVVKVCISREFALFAADRASPVVDWLRALAAHAHRANGGAGVGVIGMCLTGNFALTMMLDALILAPVLLQPSLPANRAEGLHAAPDTIAAVRDRLEREDLSIRGYRFEGDRLCPGARFKALEQAFGARFEGRSLPRDSANSTAKTPPHSPVTTHLIDEAGQPTREALEEILAFLQRRLLP